MQSNRSEVAGAQDATLPAQPDVLSRKDFVAAIDGEINHFLSFEKRPGWSVWLVVAALSGVTWTAFNEWDTARIDFHRFVCSVLFVSIGYDTVVHIVAMLNVANDKSGNGPRFIRSAPLLASSRTLILAYILRAAVLIALAWSMPTGWLALYASTVHYGGVCMFLFAVFVFTMLRLPIPSGGKSPRGALAVQLALVTPGAAALTALAASLGHISTLDDRLVIKEGVPCAASGVLLLRLARLARPVVFPQLLLDIRRDVAFGDLPVADASARAEQILRGARSADVLDEDYASLFVMIAEYRRTINEAIRQVNACRDIMPQGAAWPTKSTLLAMNALLDIAVQHTDKLKGIRLQIETELSSLLRRVTILRAMQVEQAAVQKKLDELKTATKGLDELRDNAITSIAAFRNELRAMDTRYNDATLKQSPSE